MTLITGNLLGFETSAKCSTNQRLLSCNSSNLGCISFQTIGLASLILSMGSCPYNSLSHLQAPAYPTNPLPMEVDFPVLAFLATPTPAIASTSTPHTSPPPLMVSMTTTTTDLLPLRFPVPLKKMEATKDICYHYLKKENCENNFTAQKGREELDNSVCTSAIRSA